MNKIKGIISDDDGTLVNTMYMVRHGQYEAAVEYLLSLGVDRAQIPAYEVYEDFINKSVGGSTRDTFMETFDRLYAHNNAIDLSKVDYGELDRTLNPIQDRLAPLYVHPFHGLTRFLQRLGQDELSLGIFGSGTPHMLVRNFGISIPALGYSDLYRDDTAGSRQKLDALMQRTKAIFTIPNLAVATTEDVTNSKPSPEGILLLLDQLQLTKDEVVLLGDHPVDIEAARRAGIMSIGISHGFGTPAELKAAGATIVIDHLMDAIEIVEQHNSGEKLLPVFDAIG